MFFSKFLSFIFFWQIWYQNLDFFKLTEFGKKVRCYMVITNFMCIFPKFLSLMVFGKIWWVHCYMLIMVLMFIFSTLFSFIFFVYFWSQNLRFFKLTEFSTEVDCYMCAAPFVEQLLSPSTPKEKKIYYKVTKEKYQMVFSHMVSFCDTGG